MTREEHRRKAMAERRRAQQRKMRNRRIVLTALLVVLVAALSIGGTVAWLTATTSPVVNTFTVGNINIALEETTGVDYKIVPGVDITKDPYVTVKSGSEACWLFVKVEETAWPTVTETDGTRKVSYSIANGWAKLTGVTGVDNVYYREVTATSSDTSFYVLSDNKVTVSANLTKTEADAITTPKLTFTAYAVQKDGVANAADAWAKVTN